MANPEQARNNPKANRERVKELREKDRKKKKRTMPRTSTGIRSHMIGRRSEEAEGGKVVTDPTQIYKDQF